MAKNEAKKATPSTTKTAGIGTRDWRGHTVFFCLTPGCVADSEHRANIERHIERGRHRIAGQIIVKTKPAPVVAEDVVDEDDTKGDD